MKATIESIAQRTALVLETNNIRSSDLDLVASSLRRVLGLLSQQTIPLTQLAQLVVTHDGLPQSVCEQIESELGCPITFVTISETTGYYEAKNLGFDHTTPELSDYVLFADADCTPDAHWIEQILQPFTDEKLTPTLAAVAGRTSYADSLAGIALTTIDFMYFPSPLGAGCTRNFYANNIVFKRDVFAKYHYQAVEGVYRAHCQVLGLQLQSEGLKIQYAPEAHTVHMIPDHKSDVVKLRWMRGQDTVGLTPFLVKSYMPSWLQWLAKSGPVGPWIVQMSRLGFSLKALNRQGMPRVTGLRWIAPVMLILGISSIDTLGAIVRGCGINTVGGKGGGDAQALSYHEK